MIHFKISPEEKFYPKKIYKDFLTVSTSFFQEKKKKPNNYFMMLHLQAIKQIFNVPTNHPPTLY